jgi:uncharacterized glyoxalase superfamily protein PhnB
MRRNRSIPDAAVIPVLGYPDVPAAARWLCDAFGFAERLRIADHRVQLTYAGGAMVVAQAESAEGERSGHSMLVRVEDADAHCARAEAAGARITQRPTDHAYGERQYSAVDPGGHRWTFSQTIADADPAEWGGELVSPAG